MNKIFKAASLLAAAGALLAACTKPEIGAGTITVTPASIEFEAVGAAEQTISINADGQWYIYAPEWLSVTPLEGNGNCELKIAASDNVDSYKEVCAPRADVMSIWSLEGASASVSVSQKGEAGLDATRTFVKVTEASQITTDKQFLIVADNKGTLYAMSFFNQGSQGDGYYSYIDGEKVSANEDGSISYSGNKIQYTLAAKGDKGYTLAMSNGFMLWQNNDTHTNFYSTKDKAKASTFTISFDSETKCALIDNASAGNKRVAMDGTKNSFGAYTSTDGKILPSLYIDQAAPSTEVLRAEEKTTVSSSTTSASIAVTANCKWTVRNHDSWIKNFTKSGENNGSIEITFDANTTGAARTAEFLIIGQAGNTKIYLTQNAPLKTVAELNTLVSSKATSYEFEAKDLLVTYVNGSNAFFEDKTGGILLYLKGHEFKVGDKINGLFSGSCTLYSNLPELTSFEKSDKLTITSGAEVKPTKISLKDLNANFKRYISCLVQIDGIEVETGVNSSSKTGKVKTADGSVTVYNKGSMLLVAGSKGSLIGTPAVNKDANQLNVWEPSHFIASYTVSEISVKSASLKVAPGATANVNASVNVDAPLSYVSSDPAVATVDDKGTVTGVGMGTATITVSIAAGEKWSSAETKVTVTVAAAKPEIEIAVSDMPDKYPDPETTFSVGVYDFYDFNVANFGRGIQFKKGVGAYIANKTALPRIKTITFVEKTGKTHPTLVVTAGTAAKPEDVTITSTDGKVYDFSGGNYTFFMIKNGSSTSYLDKIIITFFK
ncbi:MAG: Ig-like domain-containing protein [Candidatus Cryptobacteroides sp.]|nr:Ig-like domain-containing protein [Candidatus Cryptobacteroides sp.]